MLAIKDRFHLVLGHAFFDLFRDVLDLAALQGVLHRFLHGGGKIFHLQTLGGPGQTRNRYRYQ